MNSYFCVAFCRKKMHTKYHEVAVTNVYDKIKMKPKYLEE